MQPKYDYTSAGFNGLMSRSLKANQFATALPGASNSSGTMLNFDRQQINGPLGNTLQIGGINIDGANEDITLSDGVNPRLLIGTQQGGFAT